MYSRKNESFQYDISIIVPVFNGQDTIVRCLDSIFAIDWDYKSYEIIVVDDCSTDNTLGILQNLAQRHTNLLVIHLEVNSKPGAARNRGIERALGQYILFVDADDTIEPAAKFVLDYAQKNDIDMCHFQISTDYKMEEQLIPEKKGFNGIDFSNYFYKMACDTGYFFSYLYSRSFLKRINHPFIENRVHEDADWCEYLLWNCYTIAHINTIVYKHYTRHTSIMHSLSSSGDADNIMMCYRRLRFAESIKDNAPNTSFKSQIIEHCILWIRKVFSFRHMSRYNVNDINSLYSRIDNNALKYLKSLKWSGFPSICIKYKFLAKVVLAFTHPVAFLIRYAKQC